MRIGAGTIQFGTQSMPVLAEALSDTLQRFVTDRTRLTGNYSALVTYAADAGNRGGGPDIPVADSNAPSIFTALQEQLGLKLESTRGPVEMLVIDHIERPTED
jgi:uncharacterized protein (TIGR03435 family)